MRDFGCAFLGQHIGSGYVQVVVSWPFVGFSAAGNGFNGTELEAGKTAITVIEPLLFAFGKYLNVVDRADIATDEAAVAVLEENKTVQQKLLRGSTFKTYSFHISMKYTLFYRIDDENERVVVIDAMGMNQAHRKYDLF